MPENETCSNRQCITALIAPNGQQAACEATSVAALVSAQSRKRLYWTNIPNITQPIDNKIYLKDIIEGELIDMTYDEKVESIKSSSLVDY